MSKPRCYTRDEIQAMFLEHCADLMAYWLKESRAADTRSKMEGVIFSILAALDGSSCNLPGFIVAPCPHESDKQYHKDEGENWFPRNKSDKIKGDIGGSLHERWGQHASKVQTPTDGINLKRVLMELGNRLVVESRYAPATVPGPGPGDLGTTAPLKDITDWINRNAEAQRILKDMGFEWPVVTDGYWYNPPERQQEQLPPDEIPF